VDALLVSSPGHAAQWRSAHAAPRTLQVADVMEASADLQPLPGPEARARSGLAGDPAVLWVGRLTANKDPLTMLEGFSCFLDQRRDATLSMVFNGGTMLEAVRARLAGDSRLAARVRLVGEVAQSDMAAYYSAADIYVSASHHEGSGYAALEAMACGALPVLTDIPSFRVLTDQGRVGALWQTGQPQSLCQALVRVAAGTCAALRTSVRERFESALSWEVLGRRAVGIYRDVCAR
jgi:glycosyltransferase involved in cell wall biosynthesis